MIPTFKWVPAFKGTGGLHIPSEQHIIGQMVAAERDLRNLLQILLARHIWAESSHTTYFHMSYFFENCLKTKSPKNHPGQDFQRNKDVVPPLFQQPFIHSIEAQSLGHEIIFSSPRRSFSQQIPQNICYPYEHYLYLVYVPQSGFLVRMCQ